MVKGGGGELCLFMLKSIFVFGSIRKWGEGRFLCTGSGFEWKTLEHNLAIHFVGLLRLFEYFDSPQDDFLCCFHASPFRLSLELFMEVVGGRRRK